MARRLGLSGSWAFVDVFGLDDECLSFVPQPCLAVIFLFNSRTEVRALSITLPIPRSFDLADIHHPDPSKGPGRAFRLLPETGPRTPERLWDDRCCSRDGQQCREAQSPFDPCFHSPFTLLSIDEICKGDRADPSETTDAGPIFHYLEHARGLSPEDRGNALANVSCSKQ